MTATPLSTFTILTNIAQKKGKKRTGIEACFESSDEESDHDRRRVSFEETESEREHPPREEERPEPQRGPKEALQHNIGRHVEDAVGDGEQGHRDRVAVGAHVERLEEGIARLRVQDLRIADVGAVEVVDEVHPETDGHEVEINLAPQPAVSLCVVRRCGLDSGDLNVFDPLLFVVETATVAMFRIHCGEWSNDGPQILRDGNAFGMLREI